MDKQYIFTERAHLMCPNMNFGISETIKSPFDAEKIRSTMSKLAEAHPFLRALLGYEEETNQYFYDVTDALKAELIFYGEEKNGDTRETVSDSDNVSTSAISEEYRKLTSREWDLRKEGMLKAVFRKKGDKTEALFVFHHLLADGRGALFLANEFARLYSFGGEYEAAPEQLIADKSELPELPWISRMLVNRCNKNWQKENHFVKYEEYLAFANEYLQSDNVTHEINEVGAEEMQKHIVDCKANAVSVNDYLLAKMMIEDKTNKVIIAQDIRSQLPNFKPGALGNYSTAMSIICKTKSDDVLTETKRVHAAVQKMTGNPKAAMTVLSCYAAMEPALIDAVAISTLGKWESKAGEFVGSAMFGYKQRNGFSITNLGAFNENAIETAMFIPPASPAMQKTLGVLTVNGKMTICSSQR